MTTSVGAKRSLSPELFGQGVKPAAPKKRRVEYTTPKKVQKAKFFKLSENDARFIFEFLEPEDLFQVLALTCKQMNELIHSSFTSYTFAEESAIFDDADHMVSVVTRMNRLEDVHFDGYEELTDSVLISLISKCPNLKTLHIRQCNISYPKIESKTLRELKLSLCTGLNKLQLNCEHLEVLEFYDCHIAENPKLQTPALHSLKFFGCSGLTDKRLVQILKQFDDHSSLMQSGEQSATGGANVNWQSPERRPTHPTNKKLKNLWITECDPVQNPFIQCDSLEDLRIINCRSLNHPFIRCLNLKNLQLNWCENLDNLVLGCDSLKSIDLTGAGANHTQRASQSQAGDQTFRETIVKQLLSHYGENISITY